MAKGISTFKQLGKIDGRKYYTMKGVDGIVSSNINQGMSNKVKNDPAYDNTRRNNYEFGMATSTAGAITKAFSQKWRYLLAPFATAKLAKDALRIAKTVATAGWGNRALSSDNVLSFFPDLMQKVIKNDISDFSNIAVSRMEIEGDFSILVSANDLINDKAMAAGCDGVRVVVTHTNITPATGGYDDKAIVPALAQNTTLGTQDVDFGDDLSLSIPLESSYKDGIDCIVLLPYRTIGTDKYIMQEFCSAKFVSYTVE